MNSQVAKKGNEDPLSIYIADFHDAQGWWHAFFGLNGRFNWKSKKQDPTRPTLYYAASLQYKPGDEYFAVDGMGRTNTGHQQFECTINPWSGKFEHLCVQARDSLCTLPTSTWDRTVLRYSGPQALRPSLFVRQGIHKSKRWELSKWDAADWWSVTWRSLPAGVGLSIVLMFLPKANQPIGKDPYAYLPFRYSGYRYPRMARNFWENRREIHQLRLSEATPTTDGKAMTYRALKPRYLCYLEDITSLGQCGQVRRYFKTRPVGKNDHTPYVFISYTKEQFIVDGNPEATSKNYQRLFAWAISATDFYARSLGDDPTRPEAFWIDMECQPLRRYNQETGKESEELTEAEKKELTDHDVYTMSDIIREAEHTIVLAQDKSPAASNDASYSSNNALIGWGERVWTLPEVILSRASRVTLVVNGNRPQLVPKVRLAELAWRDAGAARQLVEHFTNLHLSRLELVSIAMKCLQERTLKSRYKGDRSYALMGLLRLRPVIDSEDSSFQAFARLSLPQDNDQLMERLICLLPKDPDEPWDKMSDIFNSSLWDIYPDSQVCGVGENDTIVVDGLKGGLIQWSTFSSVNTTSRATLSRRMLMQAPYVAPILLLISIILLAYPDARAIGGGLFVVALAILLPMPLLTVHVFSGKFYEVEPCLFGIEGYVPLPEVEEMLFGLRQGRLQWSTYGSPLSRHRYRARYRERKWGEYGAGGNHELLLSPGGTGPDDGGCVWTYPVEAVDPCSVCEQCEVAGGSWSCEHHETVGSVERKSRSAFGDMKVFMLVDTVSMTATLFESRRPPVALIIAGSEGGMKRALACSYDVTTGILYRETVLRLPSQTKDKMHSLPRVRLGLKSPYNANDVVPVEGTKPMVPGQVASIPPLFETV